MTDKDKIEQAAEPYGYVFENRFYKSLDELSGHTMHEGNTPIAVFTKKPTEEEEAPEIPVLIGHLNKPYGWNQFKIAQVGHPVYQFQDRYQITVESVTPDAQPYTGSFYREGSFKELIDFIPQTQDPGEAEIKNPS